MNCLTHADTNGNTLLQRAEEGQDSVGFLKKLYLYTNISLCTIVRMPHSTQDMNCLTHADTNGNILLAKPEEEVQDPVGFF